MRVHWAGTLRTEYDWQEKRATYMGMRGNVVITYDTKNKEKIFFYTHWHGHVLAEIVRQALIRGKPRWGDQAYLARIIFSEMIKDEVLEETGYGIAPYECYNEYPWVEVDMKEQTVKVGPITQSFEDYIEEEKAEAE